MQGVKQMLHILITLGIAVSGSFPYIAGYEPQSDVVPHALIDLDVEDIIDLLPSNDGGQLLDCSSCDWESDSPNLVEALYIWENGKNSAKSSSNRSIAGFARGAESKSSGNSAETDVDYKDNSFISVMNDYWASKNLDMYTWGYQIVNASFYGTRIGDIDFGAVGDDFRREVIQKGIVYLNVYPYVIWEMQDAINDCNTGDISKNDNSVHAWDEAVAFYTGSLEMASQGGIEGLNSCSSACGQLQFALAEKRCKNFGTCTADYDNNGYAGYAKANSDIFSLFTQGRAQILGAAHTGTCPDTPDTMEKISGLMLIPFMQGVQRYLYKTSVPNIPSAKEAGELFAFASAVLPFIHKADPGAAEMLYNRAWLLDYTTDTWKDIKYAIEAAYPKLGVGAGMGVVTCEQVGELGESDVVLSEACVDPVIEDEKETYENIAGYEPMTDVVQHSLIDLDVKDIINLLPANDGSGFRDCSLCDWDSNSAIISNLVDALDIYENGKNSAKSSSMRSIAAFSSGAETKSSGNSEATDVDYKDNSFISVMNDYWASKNLDRYTWGYQIINASFHGTEIGDIDFGKVGDDFRKEAIQKGIVYLNVYPYVIWEMQDAINDCNTGDVSQNDNSVHAWDEAVAFYTGSLEGALQGGLEGLDSCSDICGQLQFQLAEKRCKNYGTCISDYDNNAYAGYAKVNADIFSLFTQGRDQILGAAHTGKCPDTPDTMEKISGMMLIPFIQGVQRYLYKTGVAITPSAKETGELFAFASAVLPFIHKADPTAAEMLYNRAWLLDYREDNWMDIKHAIEATYPKLGVGAGTGVVTCEQVGELRDNDNVYSAACVDAVIEGERDSETSTLPTWVIALIIVLCVLLLIITVYVISIRREYAKVLPLLEANTKEDGVQMM
jgi:hypothetical protein